MLGGKRGQKSPHRTLQDFFDKLIMLLPLILGSNSVWFAMPIAEAATAVYVTASIAQVQKAFQKPEC